MHNTFFRLVTAWAVMISMCSLGLAQTKAFDTSRMDRSVEACNDFFTFANGSWVKSTEIPASESRWGSFNMLSESNRDTLHSILEDSAKNPKATGNAKLIGDFYSSCMDEAAIEKAGAHPLDPIFARIDKIKTPEDLKREIADLHQQGFP